MNKKESLSFEELLFAENSVVLAWFDDCTAQEWMKRRSEITRYLYERLAYLMRKGPMSTTASSLFGLLVRGFIDQAKCRIEHEYHLDSSVAEWTALMRFVEFSTRKREDAKFVDAQRTDVERCACKLLEMVAKLERAETLAYETILAELVEDWLAAKRFSKKQVLEAILLLAQRDDVVVVNLNSKPTLFRVPDPS